LNYSVSGDSASRRRLAEAVRSDPEKDGMPQAAALQSHLFTCLREAAPAKAGGEKSGSAGLTAMLSVG